MNKNELISAVAEKCEMTKAQAGDAVDAMLDTVTGALAGGDEVRILGFGNFVHIAKRQPLATREQVKLFLSRLPKLRNSSQARL